MKTEERPVFYMDATDNKTVESTERLMIDLDLFIGPDLKKIKQHNLLGVYDKNNGKLATRIIADGQAIKVEFKNLVQIVLQ